MALRDAPVGGEAQHTERDHAEQVTTEKCRVDPVNIHGDSVGEGHGRNKPYSESATKPHAKSQKREEKERNVGSPVCP